jgi:uroporphyrinogen decarboxylase
MVEGGGAKSYNHARSWLYSHPKESQEVLDLLTNVIIEYLVCQVKAGAQMLEVFDSNAGDLSYDSFCTYSLPSLKRIATETKKRLAEEGLPVVPMTCFARGANFALKELADTDYDVLSLDWSTRNEDIAPTSDIKQKVRYQGNLDPSVLYADEETVKLETRKMIDRFGTKGYIANLGHGMLPNHDPDKLKVFVDEVHRYSEEVNAK